MSNRKSFISSIVSKITSTVNEMAFKRMTADGSFDVETAYWEMKSRGYETLGEYVNQNLFHKLFSRNAY